MMLSTTSEVLDKIKKKEGREHIMLFFISRDASVRRYKGRLNENRLSLDLRKKKQHHRTKD